MALKDLWSLISLTGRLKPADLRDILSLIDLTALLRPCGSEGHLVLDGPDGPIKTMQVLETFSP